MVKAFLNNMAIIISFVYIMLKIKKKFEKHERFIRCICPLAAGVLSVTTIMYPFEYEMMLFDLRQVPVFVASYIFGPLGALVSAAIPVIYRLNLGGDSAFTGALLGIVLPAAVAAYFSDGEKSNILSQTINIKRALKAYAFFAVLQISMGHFMFKISSGMGFKIMLYSNAFGAVTIAIMLTMFNEEAQRLKYTAQLEHRSNHDALTGIFNRDYFYRTLNSAVRTSHQDGKCTPLPETGISLIMFDIDHFKSINDTFGHDIGDVVLKEISKVVSESIRKSDIFARVGGEEFAVVLMGSRIDEADAVAKKIRTAVESHSFTEAGKVTISLGVSQLRYGDDIDALYKRADNALYKAKRGGRNRVEVECEDIQEKHQVQVGQA